MADLSKLVDELSTLTVLEAAELSKLLEEKWGVSAAAPVAAAAPALAGGCRAAAPVEEQTEFTVILAKAGDKKINVIKEIRTITGLGPEGGQGSRRGRAEDGEGRREQGRGREDQEGARGAGRSCRGQVRHELRVGQPLRAGCDMGAGRRNRAEIECDFRP